MRATRSRMAAGRAAMLCLLASGSAALAEEPMPVAEQNALVKKYCAVCHTDAARNGGLSLEHFDAAQAPPSLMAMMLSKLTGGVLMERVKAVPTDPKAAALVDVRMKTGAMGAAGIGVPPKATIDALIHAFAAAATGATNWTVERASGKSSTVTASLVREMPSGGTGEAESYRLIASCSPATQEGFVQLAWSPVAQSGRLEASVDGHRAVEYPVEGSEKMGNHSGLELHAVASLMLAESRRGGPKAALPFPAKSLTIRDLFPGETVTFSFEGLQADARRDLQSCFSDSATAENVIGRPPQ